MFWITGYMGSQQGASLYANLPRGEVLNFELGTDVRLEVSTTTL